MSSHTDVFDAADFISKHRAAAAPVPHAVVVLRALTVEDLELLSQKRLPKEYDLKNGLKAKHRLIAMNLAAGANPIEVAATVGVHQQTIYLLQKSPAFQELVASYTENHERRIEMMAGRVGLLAESAIEKLEERLGSDDEVV